MKFEILIHPKSIEEIEKDVNEVRKEIARSKINTYQKLESPPDQNRDNNFLRVVGYPSKTNDDVDNAILFSVYKDAVDFLVTEDKGIHKKSARLGIKERVFSLEEAHGVFKKDIYTDSVGNPPALKKDFVYNLNLDDKFFDSLKEEYGESEFKKWFKKISREGRNCWVHFRNDNTIGALLIYKVEDEPIPSIPPLPAKKRLKLSTFKVSHIGYKIGELFLKLAVEYSIKILPFDPLVY